MTWLADVLQEYLAIDAGSSKAGSIIPAVLKSALIIQITLIAPSAQEAMQKAVEWLCESKIENAYVSQVCRKKIEYIII